MMNKKRLGVVAALIVVIVSAQLLLRKFLLGNELAQMAISDTVEMVILPTYRDFAEASRSFVASADAFCEQIDRPRLTALQNSWKLARIPWKQAEAFLFGPVISDRIRSAVDYRMIRLNDIEKLLEQVEPMTQEAFAKLGAPLTGFSAAEFVLFELLPQRPEIYQTKQTCLYLSYIAKDIARAADRLVERWSGGSEPYHQLLIKPGPNNNEYATTQQVLDVIVNHSAYLANEIAMKKLGRPLGEGSNFPQPDEVESRYSQNSWSDLQNNLIGLEKILSAGQFNDDSKGILGLLQGKKPELAKKIRLQLKQLREQLVTFDMPLSEAVLYEKGRVISIYNEALSLNQSISVDLINTLGVTATFSENDGD